MKPGDRVNLEQLTVTRVSTYEKVLHHEKTLTVWRYELRDSYCGRYVYSGICLGLLEGTVCDIRATIKSDDRQTWGCWRLGRVKVTGRGKLEKMI